MPPKKSHVGRKYKGQSDNPMFRAAKAASDAAVASGKPNPTPMGRPWPTPEAGVQLLTARRSTECHLSAPGGSFFR